MRKTFAKSALPALLCLLIAVCLAFVPSAVKSDTASADELKAEITSGGIEKSYAYGEIITLPQTVTVSYGGSDYTGTDGILIYPDGSAKTGGGTLDKLGEYAARYRFTADGTELSADAKFVVGESAYTFTSENGSSV